eukprot:8148080-Pyramimonas_sp.AAC.1
MPSTVLAYVGILRPGTSTDRLHSRAAPSGCGDAPSFEWQGAHEMRGRIRTRSPRRSVFADAIFLNGVRHKTMQWLPVEEVIERG